MNEIRVENFTKMTFHLDNGETITATPREIYEALEARGREVSVNKVIVPDGEGCDDCQLSCSCRRTDVCDTILDDCPGTGEYDVILRKRGGE